MWKRQYQIIEQFPTAGCGAGNTFDLFWLESAGGSPAQYGTSTDRELNAREEHSERHELTISNGPWKELWKKNPTKEKVKALCGNKKHICPQYRWCGNKVKTVLTHFSYGKFTQDLLKNSARLENDTLFLKHFFLQWSTLYINIKCFFLASRSSVKMWAFAFHTAHAHIAFALHIRRHVSGPDRPGAVGRDDAWCPDSSEP